jgi:hypothetical protein
MKRILSLCLVPAGLVACHHSSSGGANGAPTTTLEILGPWVGDPGLVVALRFVADDPDSVASSDVAAVPLFAGASEILLAQGVPEQDGIPEQIDWDTTGVAAGPWTIEVRTSDGTRTATVRSPDRIELGALAPFPRVLTDGSGLLLPATQATQESGGVLVAGSFFGDVGLGVGGASEVTLGSPFDKRELFLARYASDGELDWHARTHGRVPRGGPTLSSAAPHDLLALDGGGAFAVGAFFGELVFGEGEPGETVLELPADEFVGGFFAARWHGDGSLAWARQGAGALVAGMTTVELADGNFLVAGSARTQLTPALVFGPSSAPEHELDATTSAGAFLATYSRDGALLAAQGMPLPVAGQASMANLYALDVNEAGEVFVAGWFAGSVRVAEGGNVVTSPSPQDLELFVARVPAPSGLTRGSTSWINASQSASIGFVSPLAVVALPGGGCGLAATRYDTAVTFDAGLASQVVLPAPDPEGELFLAAYTDTGALRFARDTGIVDPADDLAPQPGSALVALADGTLVLATLVDLGNPGETLILAPDGPDAIALLFEDEEGLVLSGWSPDGLLLWALVDGGPNPNFGLFVLERRPAGGLQLLGRGAEVLGAFTPNETLLPDDRAFFLARYGEDGSF